MELCCCGNQLREVKVKITVHPCQCDTPLTSRRAAPPNLDPLSWVSERQYIQRTRLGLPIMCDAEKASVSIW